MENACVHAQAKTVAVRISLKETGTVTQTETAYFLTLSVAKTTASNRAHPSIRRQTTAATIPGRRKRHPQLSEPKTLTLKALTSVSAREIVTRIQTANLPLSVNREAAVRLLPDVLVLAKKIGITVCPPTV